MHLGLKHSPQKKFLPHLCVFRKAFCRVSTSASSELDTCVKEGLSLSSFLILQIEISLSTTWIFSKVTVISSSLAGSPIFILLSLILSAINCLAKSTVGWDIDSSSSYFKLGFLVMTLQTSASVYL